MCPIDVAPLLVIEVAIRRVRKVKPESKDKNLHAKLILLRTLLMCSASMIGVAPSSLSALPALLIPLNNTRFTKYHYTL